MASQIHIPIAIYQQTDTQNQKIVDTMPIPIQLSIIIVNWMSRDLLRNCLASIHSCAHAPSLEVVVIDNASFDGCGEMLQSDFPETMFIQNTINSGFGEANNLGYSVSNGRLLLFLNPDTEIVGSALGRLVSVLETEPYAGIVGARLLNSDSSLQTSCVQAFPSILNQLLDSEALRTRFPRARLWGTQALFEEREGPTEVEAVSGACLMIRRDVFESIKMFSPEYYMYSEDLDLCFKSAAAGWRRYYVSDAIVIHHGGRSSSGKPESHFATVMLRESQRRFFQLRVGPMYSVLYRTAMGLAAVCRLVPIAGFLLLTLGRFRGSEVRAALGKWIKVLRWSIGFERWVHKPT